MLFSSAKLAFPHEMYYYMEEQNCLGRFFAYEYSQKLFVRRFVRVLQPEKEEKYHD